MTEYKDLKPGIWEGKEKRKGDRYNLILTVYGEPPFCDVMLCNIDGGIYTNLTETRKISDYEFGEWIGALPKPKGVEDEG